MSNTKRPSLTPRPATRASKAAKQEGLDQGVKVTLDGTEYSVRMGDLSALDTMALRREVGFSWIGLLKETQKDPDIDLIAAIVWLARRIKGEVALSYEEVLEGMDYGSDFEVDEVAGAESDPEA